MKDILKHKFIIKAAVAAVVTVATVILVIYGINTGNKGYSKTAGKEEGSITKDDDGFVFRLKSIFSGTGTKIDYISGIKLDDGIELTVDSSGVDTSKAGSYTVVYTVTDGKVEESESVEVNIRDAGNADGNEETEEEPDAEKTDEVIDGGRKYPVKDIEPAQIELLSGKKATVPCSTARYIKSTKTDSYNIKKNGNKYQVSELIVVFNTGEEQVLETIQKKID